MASCAGPSRRPRSPAKIIVSPPKTDAGRRVVTLPKVAVEALAAHLEKYADPDPDGLVFTTPGTCIWCAVPSTGSCGGRRSSSSPWTGCGSMTCGTRRPRWRRRPGRRQGADGADGAHLAGGGPALPACDGRPAGPASPRPWTIWPGSQPLRPRARPGHVRARRGHGGAGRGARPMPPGGLPGRMVERVTGIEPASRAWKARALPLSYTRVVGWGEGIRGSGRSRERGWPCRRMRWGWSGPGRRVRDGAPRWCCRCR
jgi:hypothetical protein